MPDINDLPRIKGSWLYSSDLHKPKVKAHIEIDYGHVITFENQGEYIYCHNTEQRVYFEIRKTNIEKDYLQLWCPMSGKRVQHLTFDPWDNKFKRSRDIFKGYYGTNRRSKLQRSLDGMFSGAMTESKLRTISNSKIGCLFLS